ncbi:hypothetical protein MPNT_560005 [Candidatus Methylacidithermus pantelleriae]|uniref:Uncharacterized protein n=1 Tax=Candidatus Methylacidithermus pantelleriae TaxID=2744239 RepID=A0A8J2BVV8_9BACT|nr:hypothetical protein MPNT_560005 [Candidatus Methylacidithermus pantelleriae]
MAIPSSPLDDLPFHDARHRIAPQLLIAVTIFLAQRNPKNPLTKPLSTLFASVFRPSTPLILLRFPD